MSNGLTSETLGGNGSFIVLLQPLVIMQINRLYRSLAHRLTEQENHKNRSNFENSKIVKIFLFEFIDSFFGLFYICFVTRDFDDLRKNLVNI